MKFSKSPDLNCNLQRLQTESAKSVQGGYRFKNEPTIFAIMSKFFQGYSAPVISGIDCHDFFTEQKIMSDLPDKKIIKIEQKILTLCRIDANTKFSHQREQFKRVNLSGA